MGQRSGSVRKMRLISMAQRRGGEADRFGRVGCVVFSARLSIRLGAGVFGACSNMFWTLSQPSILGRIKLFGDLHRFLYLVQEVDFGRVGAGVAEEWFGGFLAKL
jgi:hypothetical protein